MECCLCDKIVTDIKSCVFHFNHDINKGICKKCIKDQLQCLNCGQYVCCGMINGYCEACQCDRCDKKYTWLCDHCLHYWCDDCAGNNACPYCTKHCCECERLVVNTNHRCYGSFGPCYKYYCPPCYEELIDGRCLKCTQDVRGP
ncbi:MAG TPA: hypothetical protein VLG50_02140 [Candidatus Saccharimonadales bacterium]|nr:hypothetical protein [Candidatus Saccharimonadales bacterium]